MGLVNLRLENRYAMVVTRLIGFVMRSCIVMLSAESLISAINNRRVSYFVTAHRRKHSRMAMWTFGFTDIFKIAHDLLMDGFLL